MSPSKLSPVSFHFAAIVVGVMACDDCEKDACYFLSLTDQELYDAGLNNEVGGCYISECASRRCACSVYVKTAKFGSNGYHGWPRDINNEGTGCVLTPNSQNHCFFTHPQYSNWPMSDLAPMCTTNGIANAAAQLRHAIRSDQCDIPCGGPCKRATYFLLLSDDALFEAATNGSKVGGCYISTSSHVCDLYVVTDTLGAEHSGSEITVGGQEINKTKELDASEHRTPPQIILVIATTPVRNMTTGRFLKDKTCVHPIPELSTLSPSCVTRFAVVNAVSVHPVERNQ